MAGDTRRDWHDMDHDELITEVRLWRARAMQNRSERERVETEAENWKLRHKLERHNLIKLRDSSRERERRLRAQVEELGGVPCTAKKRKDDDDE